MFRELKEKVFICISVCLKYNRGKGKREVALNLKFIYHPFAKLGRFFSIRNEGR